LITGGTTRIGFETARQFLKEGAPSRLRARMATLDATRNDLGSDVLVISADAGGLEAQQTLAKTIREALWRT